MVLQIFGDNAVLPPGLSLFLKVLQSILQKGFVGLAQIIIISW